MQCPSCERECRADARFCDRCGAELPESCSCCGRALRPAARFCDGCGQPVEESRPSDPGARPILETPEPSPVGVAPSEGLPDPRAYTPRHLAERIIHQRGAIEGERKHVTVLFADVPDSTVLAERTDAEEMHGIMDAAFQRILDQVHHFEGTVNQFLGDGVMALFGAPLALEDAPRRAVLAALGIQRALVDLDAEVRARHDRPFHMRIGIHSGHVVVGRIGDDLRMDYTAVGDTTHLADRLQARATPGSVVISEATRSLVEGFFELRDLGTAPAKGFAEPVRAFEVTGERAARDRVEAGAAAGLTPFVGRESEIGALQHAFATASDGRGQLVIVAGDAGIGKSRLLYEFRAGLAGEAHHWLEGRCSAYGTSTAFLAISDALRRHCGIEDRDDEAAASLRLEEAVRALGEDLDWTLPFLRSLLSLPTGSAEVDALDGKARRGESVRALQLCLMRLAEKRPLVFVVEDLHWIDPASEELLLWLVDAIPAARVLMVLTCRPGYQQPFGERSYAVRLPVQPLSSDAMSSMAGSLLADAMPAELLRLVSGKAEGNPFFVEEILKSLEEEGALAQEDGRVVLRRDLSELSVPDSIEDVLMARLDRLADGPKRAIQVASVIGREFALRLLAAIREAGDRVNDVVGELRSLELIYEKAAHPELAFMFKHALTHDVAYESILRARRKGLHLIVATAIEELYADRLTEHYEALAHHLERAEEWQRAIDYHAKAAQRAGESYANSTAIDHLTAALALADRLPEELPDEGRVVLEERLGLLLRRTSEFRRAFEAFRRAADATSDPKRRARDLARAAGAAAWGHLYDELDESASSAVQAAQAAGDLASEALARGAVALTALATQGPRDASERVAKTFELIRSTGDPEALVQAQAVVALGLEQGGRFPEAIEQAEASVALTRQLCIPAELPQWVLGLALTCQGEYGRALSLIRDAIALCERCGDRAMRGRLLNSLGWLYAEVGGDEIARGPNEASASVGAQLVDQGSVVAPEVLANARINLGNNWTAIGETGRALDLIEGLEDVSRLPDPWNRWRYTLHAEHALARVALARGEPESALPHLDRELAGAQEHDLLKLQARSLELRARAWLLMDDRDEARAALESAREIASEIGYPPVLWRTDSLALEIARREGDAGEAERRAAAVALRVHRHAELLGSDDLARHLRALGTRLVEEPMAAHR